MTELPTLEGRVMADLGHQVADLRAQKQRLRMALEALRHLPTREEWIGGQRAAYINLDPVTAIIDAALTETR